MASASNSILVVASILLLACLGGQVLHSYLRIMHSNPHVRRPVTVYESALLVHLLVMTALTVAIAHYGTSPRFNLFDSPIGIVPLLWINFAVAAVCAYIALADLDESGEPDEAGWTPAAEAIIACFCTPPILMVSGDYQAIILGVDAFYFIVRTLFFLACDTRNRNRIVSPLSLTEALKKLPEGFLYADEQGRTIVANDTMRRCLSTLGISGDEEQIDKIWDELNEKAHGSHAVHSADLLSREPGAWVVLHIRTGETRLFSFEGTGFAIEGRYPTPRPLNVETSHSIARQILGAAPRSRIIAYDVTKEMEVIEQIERTNDELAASQRDLIASAETTREAAENEAMLKMRGRVHDVIGQRLSMLHRALEDDAISDEKLEQLKPLLKGILDDLATDTHISPNEELLATIDAFALTGVSVETIGELPENERRAALFADCIREAATNAMKHARARTVTAKITDRTLEVSNDGMPAALPITEGTGLSNMRRAIEAEGGSLKVTPDPFTLSVRF